MSRVAVLYGGPSPEHEVSILTGLQACRELLVAHRDPLAVYWTRQGAFVGVDPGLEGAAFADGTPRDAEPLELRAGAQGGFHAPGRLGRSRRVDLDCVVLCTHGGPGEDGSLQGALDLAGVPYTGPSVAGAAIGMDKLAFAATMAHVGVPTLPRAELTATTSDVGFDGPYIVKPRFGGSSLGIDVVADLATAKDRLAANPHLARGAVIEPYRSDLEDLQVAARAHPTFELSAIERPLREGGGEILGYSQKYVGAEGMASAPRELPAVLDADVADEVRRLARIVASACLLRGIARVDFLHGQGTLVVNEVNTIPGSLSRHLFVDPPRRFLELLDDLVDEAQVAPTARYSVLGADGSVLRRAGAIASKLA